MTADTSESLTEELAEPVDGEAKAKEVSPEQTAQGVIDDCMDRLGRWSNRRIEKDVLLKALGVDQGDKKGVISAIGARFNKYHPGLHPQFHTVN